MMRPLLLAAGAMLFAAVSTSPADAQQRPQTKSEATECAANPGSAECTRLQKSLGEEGARTPGPSQPSTDPSLSGASRGMQGPAPRTVTPDGNPAAAGGGKQTSQ